MKKFTVECAGEFGLIDRINHDFVNRPELLKVGSGDDGAVYTSLPGWDQVISTDTMAEGIHFKAETMAPYDVGYKLCASNFSDMAAMGAVPTGFVVSAALPKELPVSWVERCYDGIRDCCRKYAANMLGGDMTGSPGGIILTGTVVGLVPQNQAVLRSGARKGDLIFVTETVGDSAAGLSALLHHQGERYPYLAQRHQRPEPQVEWGQKLREAGATSLNDVSDGLSSELNEIARASRAVLEIEAEKIPLSQEARDWGREIHEDPLKWALDGGEDYQLIGTIPPENFRAMKDRRGLTVIGQVPDDSDIGVYIRYNKDRMKLKACGYNHFKKTQEERKCTH